MQDDARFSNVPRVGELHPVIYEVLAGSVVWTVVALTALFSTDSETSLMLAVVGGFAAAFVGIPLWLRKIARSKRAQSKPLPFREWIHARFEVLGGTMAAGEAALLVLLAPVSLAMGLTVASVIRLYIAQGA
ncbi:MAG TPA: hypothetical protein VL966_16840 [Alphaproteobacteria bacterium]|jgi:hypothetical protein|nr:hypothetical protein [Alphaproteobacteria bacterium]